MPETSDAGTGARALEPGEARALLRECVTVVAPGETLVIRIPGTWHPQTVHDTQRRMSEIIADRGLGFTVLFVPGEELAVARPGPDPMTIEKHVEGILPALVVKELHRQVSRAMYQGRRPGAPDLSRLRVNGVTMPRQKSPDSKDVTMSARFTEAEAAAIDTLRAGLTRSEWLRRAGLAMTRERRAAASAAGPAAPKTSPGRLAELRARAAAADIEPVSDPEELARRGIEAHIAQLAAERDTAGREPVECRHENMRLHRGWCPDCETMTVKK